MEKVIKSISEGHRLKTVQREKAIIPMLAMLQKAYVDSGQKETSDDDLSRTARALYDETTKYFPTLTLDEIDLTIGKMIRGYYGEFTGVTVANIHKALKVYIHSPERAQYISMARDVNQKQLPQNAELSEHEKREKMIGYTVRAFNQLKEKGHFEDIGNAIYDFLDNTGVLKISKEKKWEIHAQAIEAVKREKINEKEAVSDPFKKAEISKYLKALEKAQGGTEISRMAKKIALNNFFSGLIEMDMDVRDFIEQKLNI